MSGRGSKTKSMGMSSRLSQSRYRVVSMNISSFSRRGKGEGDFSAQHGNMMPDLDSRIVCI